VLLESRPPTPFKEIAAAPLLVAEASVTSTVFDPDVGFSKYHNSAVQTFPGSVDTFLAIRVRAVPL